uniref:Uncharacterized protein n=1 Tax=Lotharella globosa TaxID=91324 RepID=A0A7S3YB73_9EUKA
MGITISFENDTDRDFEVSICLQLGQIVIDKKKIKPSHTWSKTDKGISASMVYTALIEDLTAPLVFSDGKYQTPKWRCPVKAPAVKGEKLYKLSELIKVWKAQEKWEP